MAQSSSSSASSVLVDVKVTVAQGVTGFVFLFETGMVGLNFAAPADLETWTNIVHCLCVQMPDKRQLRELVLMESSGLVAWK